MVDGSNPEWDTNLLKNSLIFICDDKQTDRQTDGQTDRQTDRQTDKLFGQLCIKIKATLRVAKKVAN